MIRKILYSSFIVILALTFAIPVMAQTEVTEVGTVGTITAADFQLDTGAGVFTVVPADLAVLATLVDGDFVKVTGMLTDSTISDATVILGVAGTWSGSVESIDPLMLLIDDVSYTIIPLFEYDSTGLNVGDILEVSGWLIGTEIYSEIYATSIDTLEVAIDVQGVVTSLDPLIVQTAGGDYTVIPGAVDTSLVQLNSEVWVFGTTVEGSFVITANRILVKVEYVGTVGAVGAGTFEFMTKGGATLTVTPTADYIPMAGDVLIVVGWQEGDMLEAISINVLFKGDGSDLIKQGHFCTELDDSHPVAARLAEEYGVYYEQIMSWFCVGNFGFGEIKNAFKANQKLEGYSAEEILAMKEELGGWGKVKQELGLIGKDKGNDTEEFTPPGLEKKNSESEAPGNSDHSNTDKQTGPPEHANNDKDKDKDKDK